jgi:uncharacterized protein
MPIKHFVVSSLLFVTANLVCAELSLEQVDLLMEQAKTDPNAIAQIKSFAERGDPRGENTYGLLYLEAIGMPQNLDEAFRWIQKSANHGYGAAMSNLGGMYYSGNGTKQDYSQAFQWFNKAKDQGYSGGMLGLGSLYYEGKGVTQNYEQAAYWWRTAAEQGLAQAQNNLAGIYHRGRGVPRDDAKAIEWLLKASNQNLSESQLALGSMYANGVGVKQSPIIAYAIYLVVAAKDKLIAQFYISQVTNKMSSEELSAAKRLSGAMLQEGQFQNALDTYLATQGK